MPTEIERKFLVTRTDCLEGVAGLKIRQGYICTGSCVCRARVSGKKGFLVLKGTTEGISRPEFEYEIPLKDAESMLDLFCDGRLIEKTRYKLEYEGHVWEIDLFHGRHKGLATAEVELQDPDETVELPPWVGQEVSDNPQYYNVAMALK